MLASRPLSSETIVSGLPSVTCNRAAGQARHREPGDSSRSRSREACRACGCDRSSPATVRAEDRSPSVRRPARIAVSRNATPPPSRPRPACGPGCPFQRHRRPSFRSRSLSFRARAFRNSSASARSASSNRSCRSVGCAIRVAGKHTVARGDRALDHVAAARRISKLNSAPTSLLLSFSPEWMTCAIPPAGAPHQGSTDTPRTFVEATCRFTASRGGTSAIEKSLTANRAWSM